MSEPILLLPPDSDLACVATIAINDARDVGIALLSKPLPPDLTQAMASAIAGMSPWKRYGFTPDALISYCAPADDKAPRYLVTRHNEILGLFALKLGWMFGSYLNILAVLPGCHGRGIGSAVLRWTEERARACGERNQFVTTSAFNTRALALYQRHGYEPIATMPGLISDAESEILLRKCLVRSQQA
ncbi:MAG TPA: GNAT family N-acetyltransferase [Hyphomicrobiaceae bacterium]|nr:GNAT family N-acetyltransferase [Hyphomicrobiaceae bacterium]